MYIYTVIYFLKTLTYSPSSPELWFLDGTHQDIRMEGYFVEQVSGATLRLSYDVEIRKTTQTPLLTSGNALLKKLLHEPEKYCI